MYLVRDMNVLFHLRKVRGDDRVLSVKTLNLGAPVAPPQRLSEETRDLARRGLSGEFGREMVDAEIVLGDRIPAGDFSEEMRYALAVKLIAENAPLRVLPEERVVGSATYREAVYHRTPIHGGSSTSHLTLGFGKALRIGYRGLRREIEERLSRGDLDERGMDLFRAMLVCLDAAGIWHRRHVALLETRVEMSSGTQREHYESVLANLRRVPENPPETFHEAVQAFWFMYAFQRLCGNWSGLGRVDLILGDYLKRDLEEGRITLDEAREILAHFWIKGTEWIGAREYDSIGASGDAQHYQNVVLAGIDADGNEVANEVTYLILDIVEELHISDFPVAVRVGRGTPERLLRRVAEVQRMGGGIVSIYNEDVVLRALEGLGIPAEDARTFANDGCWEVIVPGKTAFRYMPFDMLQILQEVLGLNDASAPIPEYGNFEALYRRFVEALSERIDAIQGGQDAAFSDGSPTTLVSMLIADCIEKGRGYFDRGSRYVFAAPHAGGMADVCNSLLAIRRIVFEDELLSLQELVQILREDWADQELLRRRVRNRLAYYGNDDDEADAMMRRLFDDYTGKVAEVRERNGAFRPAGISTFGREVPWREHRTAAAHGFRQDDILATNFSPTPGTDRKGPTAAIRSYCKMDFERLPNGGTLELKIHPSCMKGEQGLDSLMALLKSFIELGGFYLNVDVVDSEMLRDAQKHPERYPNLAVRISGWSARFHTLCKEWQDMIIQRTEQML